MLSGMQHRQLEPDVISFSAAITACEKGEQWQQALGMLSEMQHRQLKVPEIAEREANGTSFSWRDCCMLMWLYRCIDVWMHRCVDAWMYRCMDVCMCGCIDV